MSTSIWTRVVIVLWLAALLSAAILVLASAFASRAEALVYWANYDSIGRANLNGTGANQRFIDVPGGAGGVAVDGTGANEDFIDASKPAGVAVDAAHVYWSNRRYCPAGGHCSGTSAIARANLDGTGVDQSFIEVSGEPGGVAVDRDHVYGGSYSDGRWRIGRANLDGTGVDPQFIGNPNEFPTGLAVDGASIYWTQGSLASRGAIGRASLDGTGIDQGFIATRAAVPRGVAVDAVSAKAPPSSDFALGKLRRNRRRGTATLTVVVPGAGELALAKTRRVKGKQARADSQGRVKLLVEPTGEAKKRLRRRGQAKVKTTVSYIPDGGDKGTRSKRITLKTHPRALSRSRGVE